MHVHVFFPFALCCVRGCVGVRERLSIHLIEESKHTSPWISRLPLNHIFTILNTLLLVPSRQQLQLVSTFVYVHIQSANFPQKRKSIL